MTHKDYETTDLALAAALVTSGISLKGINMDDPRRAKFTFKGSDEIEENVEDFWNDKLRVSARKYFDTIKMLKSRIYSF